MYEHGKELGLKLVPSLTFAHIWPTVWQRMTVSLATQFFSRRMSIAFKTLREDSATGPLFKSNYFEQLNFTFDMLLIQYCI